MNSMRSWLYPSKACHLHLLLLSLYYHAVVKQDLDLRIHLPMLTSDKQTHPLLSHFGLVPLISINEEVEEITKQAICS